MSICRGKSLGIPYIQKTKVIFVDEANSKSRIEAIESISAQVEEKEPHQGS